jgi:thiamine monophosphate synthase
MILPRFYPILDTETLRKYELSALAAAEALLDAGVRILQFRHKNSFNREDYSSAAQIAELCRQA